MDMKKEEYWNLFLETGAPEAYMLFKQTNRMENTHVSDYPCAGAAGNGLQ